MAVAFPVLVSWNGRYLVDQNGIPFQVHGEAAWDIPFGFSRTDWQAYLDDRKSRGINTLLTYPYSGAVAYVNGEPAPFSFALGGSAAGTAALPFTKNTSGAAWDGDPTFAHHDADFSSTNDAYFAEFLLFVQDAAARGMVCLIFPCYFGFNQGAGDGWCQTLLNTANTTTVCTNFGTYLANGHGTFAGFKNQPNLIWVLGGDALPPNASTQSTRLKAIIDAIQAAGDTHLVTQHWQHDYLPNDSTDFSSYLNLWSSYTHGAYPTQASTAAMGRQIYSLTTTKPCFLIETDYWGGQGATRANLRLFGWHARLSSTAGYTQGWQIWTGWSSADGTPAPTSAWLPSTAVLLNQTVTHVGNWYTCTAPGTTAASGGPTGTGTGITDGTATWNFLATISASQSGFANLLGNVASSDHQVLGAFFASLPWFRLIPSGLASTGAIITAGGGTAPTFTDQGSASGGLDYVASACTDDGTTLVAYVPTAHTGAFTVDTTRMSTTSTAWWVDPTTGTRTLIPGAISNGSSHSFSVPAAANAGGDNDWVLLILSGATPSPIGLWTET